MANDHYPEPTEHLPYYGKYIALVARKNIIETLEEQRQVTFQFLGSIPQAKADHRYAPEKWSIKEVVGHLVDSERVFAYRALRFARADSLPLQGFDENHYVAHAEFAQCTLPDLANEFDLVRRSNILMFKQFSDETWLRRGQANNAEVSVRALAYIMAGHELHHLDIIRKRYL